MGFSSWILYRYRNSFEWWFVGMIKDLSSIDLSSNPGSTLYYHRTSVRLVPPVWTSVSSSEKWGWSWWPTSHGVIGDTKEARHSARCLEHQWLGLLLLSVLLLMVVIVLLLALFVSRISSSRSSRHYRWGHWGTERSGDSLQANPPSFRVNNGLYRSKQ